MSATTAKREPTVRRATTSKINRRHQIGWLFVLPFLIVFLAFLVAPLLYAAT